MNAASSLCAAARVTLSALLFGLATATGSLAQERAAPSCTLPERIAQARPRPPDYRSPTKPYDYLALVLTWSPEHCGLVSEQGRARKHAFQCVSNRFEWVVHGLWPQNRAARSRYDHPRHCAPSGPLPASLVRSHLCTVPGADLMQNEWQAHGTCGWESPDAYFTAIETAVASFAKPDFASITGVGRPDSNRFVHVRAGDLKNAFVTANPEALEPAHLRVSVGADNKLREIWICLTKNLKPTDCPTGGTPDDAVIRVRSPDQ